MHEIFIHRGRVRQQKCPVSYNSLPFKLLNLKIYHNIELDVPKIFYFYFRTLVFSARK